MRAGRTMAVQAVWVLVLGVAAAACSTGEPAAGPRPSSPPPPPPAPTRSLVAWSTAACDTVKALDDLKRDSAGKATEDFTGTSASSYSMSVTTSVRSEAQRVQALPRTGVKAADDYIAGLTKTLDDLHDRLPDPMMNTMAGPDEQKVAKAREVAKAVATLKPQAPGLTGVVKGEPRLLAAYNVTPGCEPVPSTARPAAKAPTRDLVVWSETMCTYADLPRKRPSGDSREGGPGGPPMGDQFRALQLMSFIRDAASRLDDAAERIDALPSTGMAEADRYRSRLLSSIEDAANRLPEHGRSALGRLSLGELEAEADKVAGTLETVEPTGDDLPAMVGRLPRLAAAYDLAPACEPLKQGTASPAPSASAGAGGS